MTKRRIALFVFAALLSLCGGAQSSATVKAYIQQFKSVAIAEMQRTGVPAAITLAQGIHETGAGTSNLVLRSNNHFGIKCKSEWTGDRVYHDDDARGECFRKYDDPLLSYRDHSDFLRNRPYYAALFNLDPTDYEAWAFGLKKAGYATNPRYPQILIKLIQDYNLQDYTLMALGRKPLDENEPQWAKGPAVVEEPLGLGAVATPAVVQYPEGVFEINGAKAIYVRKGVSYLKLATDNDLPLARLLDFNDLKDGDVTPDDGLLFLQRKRKTGATETHVVKPGETLYSIAQAEGMRLENLLLFNHLTADVQPAVGAVLYLDKPAPTAPQLSNLRPGVVTAALVAPAAGRAATTHTVQAGDTLFSIARRYNISVADLKSWNNLGAAPLRVGQALKLNPNR